jgi:hypothetical protein
MWILASAIFLTVTSAMFIVFNLVLPATLRLNVSTIVHWPTTTWGWASWTTWGRWGTGPGTPYSSYTTPRTTNIRYQPLTRTENI